MRYIRKLSIMLLLTSLILALMMPFAISASEKPSPLTVDAQIYAKQYGVTVDEALRRFELQKIAGTLDAELSSNEAKTFGGLWIEHVPEFRVVVLFTSNGESTAKPYLNKDLINITNVRTVNVSLANLQSAQAEVLSSFRSSGIPVDSEINIYENRVKVKVAESDRFRFDNALQNGELRIPRDVDINVVPELAKPVADIYGGLSLSDSTIGFAVRAGTTKGISASGHASNSQYYGGYSLPFQQERLETHYDVQWHTAPNFTVVNKIQWWSDGDTRNITGTVGRGTQAVGDYVVKYGKTTHYTGGHILSKDVSLAYIPNCQPTFIHVDDDAGYSPLAAGGDSGSPWFLGYDAWGITCAASGGDAYYMAVNYMSGIGVSVMTSP